MWELMGEAMSYFSTAFVLYCNRTGSEDGVTFAGGSFIYSPKGERLARASDLDEEVLSCEFDMGLVRQVRKKWTFKRDERPEIILHSLERIVRRYED
jgi:predicted amidohydrolase